VEIGVALIDAAVGGVDPGLPLVIESDQGAGKHALFLQLLVGALARGERVVLLSPEPPTLLLHQAFAIGIDLVAPLRDGRFILLEFDPRAAGYFRNAGPEVFVKNLGEVASDATFLVINPLNFLTEEILSDAELRSAMKTVYEDWNRKFLVLGVETERLEPNAGLRRVLLETCGSYLRIERLAGPHCRLHVERTRTGELPEQPLRFRLSNRGAQWSDSEGSEAGPADAAIETVRLRVPRPRESRAECPAEKPDETPRRSVLVIDDDREARERYREWLSDRYQIRIARDGSEGIAAFMADRPNLILLNLEMPKVSGFEVMRALCGASQWVPIVVLSGRPRRRLDRYRPFLLGAADVIVKPPDRFDLVRRVDALIRADEQPPEHADFALLRGHGTSRVLPERDMRRRMEGAARIARRFEIDSSLLALEVSSPDTLEAVVDVCDEELRLEDGVCPLGDTRALFLLVGAPPDGAVTGLTRLCKAFERRHIDVADLRGQVLAFQPGLETAPWPEFFKEMAPWLTLRA